jgi:hypothetical protein
MPDPLHLEQLNPPLKPPQPKPFISPSNLPPMPPPPFPMLLSLPPTNKKRMNCKIAQPLSDLRRIRRPNRTPFPPIATPRNSDASIYESSPRNLPQANPSFPLPFPFTRHQSTRVPPFSGSWILIPPRSLKIRLRFCT